jgi:hypothetical protein
MVPGEVSTIIAALSHTQFSVYTHILFCGKAQIPLVFT